MASPEESFLQRSPSIGKANSRTSDSSLDSVQTIHEKLKFRLNVDNKEFADKEIDWRSGQENPASGASSNDGASEELPEGGVAVTTPTNANGNEMGIQKVQDLKDMHRRLALFVSEPYVQIEKAKGNKDDDGAAAGGLYGAVDKRKTEKITRTDTPDWRASAPSSNALQSGNLMRRAVSNASRNVLREHLNTVQSVNLDQSRDVNNRSRGDELSEAQHVPRIGRSQDDDFSDVPRAPQVNRAAWRAGRGGRGFRGSRIMVYQNPEAREHNEYLVTKNAMHRLFPKSGLDDWTFEQYMEHKQSMLKEKQDRQQEQADHKALYEALGPWVPSPIKPAFGGDVWTQKDLHGKETESHERRPTNFSSILCSKTIWCGSWQDGKVKVAPWPTIAELKWEGDDRAKSNVGRYFPLPREEGTEGLTWQQLPAIPQYPLDQVRKVPTLEDTFLPVDEIDNEAIPALLDYDILAALGPNIQPELHNFFAHDQDNSNEFFPEGEDFDF